MHFWKFQKKVFMNWSNEDKKEEEDQDDKSEQDKKEEDQEDEAEGSVEQEEEEDYSGEDGDLGQTFFILKDKLVCHTLRIHFYLISVEDGSGDH